MSTLRYEHKPYKGNIGKSSMKYNIDKSGIKMSSYKGTIDPKNVKLQPKEYKQTINPRPNRSTQQPLIKPKEKPPKPAPRRTVKPAVKNTKFKPYEPNIKWDLGKLKVREYEPNLYVGNIHPLPSRVKPYQLPDDYYDWPKGRKKPPVRRELPKPVKKLKPNKVEPIPLLPPPPPPVRIPTPPAPKKKTPPPLPVIIPKAPEPKRKEPEPTGPMFIYYDPPSPEPLPKERYYYPDPLYESKMEPMFPPMIPISMEDYTYGSPRVKEVNAKPRGNPLIPIMYPPLKSYDDLSRYSPPPQHWISMEDQYQVKGSGVPLYSSVGLMLRNSNHYSFY